MIEDPNKIIATLLEDDEEIDLDLAKDVANVTPSDLGSLENALTDAGFKFEDGLWIKSMANQLVTLTLVGHGVGQGYSMNYYKRGERFWVFSHRYIGGGTSIINRIQKIARTPVREDLEDDEETEFEFKDILGAEDRQELYKIMDNGLLDLRGWVKRTDHHYVHERTTDAYIEPNWNWDHPTTESDTAYEEKIQIVIDGLQKEIDQDIVRWNHKIYKELEASYDDSVSEPVVAENIKANDYDFDENGRRDDDGGFKYDQLTPSAQEKAREWWVNAENETGSNYYAEPVVAEWKWLLQNKGFNDVEINWSGFWSQGDGASFTAGSIDFRKYLMGPDPLTFPEQDREQIAEAEEDEPEIDPKDVYSVDRKSISHIGTKLDYAEYEERVREFFAREGITNLSAMTDEEGNTPESFSWTPCDVCHRQLGGTRVHASDYNPTTGEIQTYRICVDCEYYAEYGKLDDMTMMDMKEAQGPGDDEDFETKELIPDIPAQGLAFPGGRIHSQPALEYQDKFPDGAWEIFYMYQAKKRVDLRNSWFLGILVKTKDGWHKMEIAPHTLGAAFPTAEEAVAAMYEKNAKHWKAAPEAFIESQDEEDFETKELLGEPPPERVFYVGSSHGNFTVKVDDGSVTQADFFNPNDEDAKALKDIVRFDVGEWRRAYPDEKIEPGDSIDILDLGSWSKDGSYEPPMADWRSDFAQYRHERQQQQNPPAN